MRESSRKLFEATATAVLFVPVLFVGALIAAGEAVLNRREGSNQGRSGPGAPDN